MQARKLIGSGPLLTYYGYSCNLFNINSVYVQSLRFRKRKPMWLPTAKTKVFRVPVRPVIPKDEFEEIKRLYNNYRTYMRSVRTHLTAIVKENEIQLDQTVLDKEEEEDYIQCMRINDEWNKSIAAERAIRLKEEKEAKRLQILENIEAKKKRDELKRLRMNEKVKLAKELAPTFITRANIDQAIEEALANVVDYNKAIDLDGNWYTDKSGLPIEKKTDKIQINP